MKLRVDHRPGPGGLVRVAAGYGADDRVEKDYAGQDRATRKVPRKCRMVDRDRKLHLRGLLATSACSASRGSFPVALRGRKTVSIRRRNCSLSVAAFSVGATTTAATRVIPLELAPGSSSSRRKNT